MRIINLGFKPQDVDEMLKHQKTTPYYECLAVDEILRAYPYETTLRMAIRMFLLGYIEGKRAERARRKKS